MISLIIPSYNQADDLPMTLESIFAQNYTDIEVVLVNDGSTDHTDKAIEPYLGRIRYVKQENKGCQAARNIGFEYSKGEYVMIMEADGVMVPHSLLTLLTALERHPEASFAYSSFMWGWKKFRSQEYRMEDLKKMNYIHTSALIRREHFSGFDPEIKKFQDWDMWLTMAKQGHTGVFVDEVLYAIGQHKGGISSWMPSFMYKVPWQKFGIHIKTIERYHTAMKVIKQKHGLT